MGKKKSKTKSSEVIAPNPVYAPQINSAADTLRPAYATAEANNKALLGQVGDVNAFNKRVMGGEFLEGNPYIEGIIDRNARDITDRESSIFESGGRYGSGQHRGILARALGDMENQVRFGNYSTERAYQDQAGGKILQGTGIAAALPQAASSTYADAIAALLGKYASSNGTSTTTQKGGLLQAMLMAGAQGAGAYAASDRRLKRDIERIGEWDDKGDGLGRYRFSYTFDPTRTILEGVMADEVKELRPQAYVPNFRGEFAGVNYGAL